ncbi:MAG: hypothetical protein MZV65_19840 [Chromatiales bacterium]|nr:hypothetical protein [Chromatiales bacterium]
MLAADGVRRPLASAEARAAARSDPRSNEYCPQRRHGKCGAMLEQAVTKEGTGV